MNQLISDVSTQSIAHVINMARHQPVEIQADDGTVFVVQMKTTANQTTKQQKTAVSLLDVAGIDTNLTQQDIQDAIQASREFPNS